jgi:hypothetical protein
MPNLWRCLEVLAGDRHVGAEWAKWSADHFEPLRSTFLRAVQNEAKFVPCPYGCGCEHEVVTRAGGARVGICRCEPCDCEDIVVEAGDVRMWEFNAGKFGRAVRSALECAPRDTALPLPRTWQIGAKFANGVPVFLTIQGEREAFRRVVVELAARQREPFILLAPTSRLLDASSRELLAGARAGFFDLESHLRFAASGALQPCRSPGEMFHAFAPDASAGATDGEARRLFALLKALESESNYRKAPVTRVFQLYCLESQSRNDVAKACRCVPSLITLRLKAIEKKLGRKPAELRTLSAQFERIAESLTDERARRLDRTKASDGDDPEDED